MTPQRLLLVLLVPLLKLVDGLSEPRVIDGGDLGDLLKRCPCVPINTCYSQGVSLNDQNFLNAHFQCPDPTLGHCCGHFYPTLGSDDFYFDETTNEGRKVPIVEEVTQAEVETTSTEMVLRAPENFTTEKIFIVWPETTTSVIPITTEAFLETTTDFVPISTTLDEEVETTTEIEETTTTIDAPTNTTIGAPATTTPTTSKPFLSAAQLQRMARLQNRPVFPKLERRTERPPRVSSSASSTRIPVRSTRVPTTTTTARIKSTTTKYPTRKSLYSTDFHQRYIASRLRNQPNPKKPDED